MDLQAYLDVPSFPGSPLKAVLKYWRIIRRDLCVVSPGPTLKFDERSRILRNILSWKGGRGA